MNTNQWSFVKLHPISRSGINQIGIPKNSKERLDDVKSINFKNMISIKSFDVLHALKYTAGGLVVNTLAYHTGDPGSIPGRGGSSEKCESIWGDFSSPACNPPSLIRGYTKGTGGDGRIICVSTVSCDQAQ